MYAHRNFLGFNVTEYGGTKSIMISTRTVMGGKNSFMGIAYIVVGGVCVLIGVLFTAANLIRPRYDTLCMLFLANTYTNVMSIVNRKLGDHTYLTWNNEPSTGAATGHDQR